jgi:hypothetical protein
MHDEARPRTYEIRIEGVIDAEWASWLAGAEIDRQSACSVLTVRVPSQAALREILFRLWDANRVLVSLQRLDP